MTIPKDWPDEETWLVFDPDCEALICSEQGEPMQGITGGFGDDRHVDYVLPKAHRLLLYVEIACNGMFGNGSPPNPNRYFKLNTVRIYQPNTVAYGILYDMQVLREAARELGNESASGWQALRTANAIINQFISNDEASLLKCREIAHKGFLGRKGASNSHLIVAVGHCHIDTAWQWPFAETRRKTARSWSRQLLLMDAYPSYKFVCSQMQQYKWLEMDYPGLFKRIKEKVKSGQFIPLGSVTIIANIRHLWKWTAIYHQVNHSVDSFYLVRDSWKHILASAAKFFGCLILLDTLHSCHRL